MKRKVAAMYTHVVLKDGTEGAIVLRILDTKISPKVYYIVDTPDGDAVDAFEEDFESVQKWEELEEEKVTDG